MKKISRNDPCPCGSGKKYKQCCQQRETPVASGRPTAATPAALQAALEHHRAGRLPQAQAIYRQILEVEPNHADALHYLGAIASHEGKYREAAELIGRAIRIKPSRTMHYNLGNALKALGDLGGAAESYRRALALKPDYAEAHVNLGNVLQAQGKLDEAVGYYRSALLSRPDLADAHVNLGNALKVLGDLDGTAESYRKALALKPDYAEAHVNLGNVLQAQGKLDEAVGHYRSALLSKPDLAGAHINLGNALDELGRLDEAVGSYQRALALRPDLAETHLSLGSTLQAQGNLDWAIVQYHKALALKPDCVDAYNNLGVALKDQDRLDEAITCCHKALALKPDCAGAHLNLGNALNAQGKIDAAIECFRKALALNPDFAEAHDNLGNTLRKPDNPDSAKESVLCFQKAFSARSKLHYEEDGELSPGVQDVFLELTNKCNFHCDFCPSDSLQRSQGYMSMELIRKIYTEVAEKRLVSHVSMHLMGEPTLHPDFMEILAFCSSRNIKTLLVTNGSTMNAKSAPKILDALHGSLTVSLQTPTRETYKHRGDTGLGWDRYIGNIRLLVREHLRRVVLKQPIHSIVDLRVMVTSGSKLSANIIQTDEDVNAVLQEWRDFVSGVELELGLPPCQSKEMLAAAMERTAAKRNERSYPLQQGLKITFWPGFSFANSRLSSDYKIELSETSKFCYHPFTDVGVLCNGDVTLCCLDYDGQLVVGNVRDDNLETVINGERARNLRAAMLSRHPMPPFCQQCQAEAIRSEPAKPINFIIPS